MSEDILWSGKDTTLLQKARIIGLHQAKKTSKVNAETTKIGLRTVLDIFKTWKDSGGPSSSGRKYSPEIN